MKRILCGYLVSCTIFCASAQVCFRTQDDYSFRQQTAGGVSTGSTAGVYLEDFDKDGKIDVVSLTGTEIHFSKGNSTGKMQLNSVIYGAQTTFVSGVAAVDDFDKDGNLDIAIGGTTSSNAPQFEVMFGNGSGSFSAYAASRVSLMQFSGQSTAQQDMVAADINNDGYPDLITNHFIYLNNKNKTFAAPYQIYSQIFLTGEQDKFYDYDKDGVLDAFIGPWLLRGLGNNYFDTVTVGFPITQISGYKNHITDFDNDGITDYLTYNITDTFFCFRKGGSASSVKIFTQLSADFISYGDYNGDSLQDVVVGNHLNSLVEIFTNTGSGFNSLGLSSVTWYPIGISSHDINGDGYDDMVVCGDQSINSCAQKAFSVLLGNGANKFPPRLDWVLKKGTACFCIDDFNNDGNLDFLGRSAANINLNLGNGAGSFQSTTTVQGTLYYLSAIKRVYACDFNNDGKKDIIEIGTNDTSWVTFQNNGANGFINQHHYGNGGIAFTDLITGDYDNDGLQDVITVNPSPRSYTFYKNNGNFSFSTTGHVILPNFPADIAAADINKDGNLDFVVVNTSSASTLLGNGNGTFQSPISSTLPIIGQNMCTGDFNGDGFVDIATANTNSVVIAMGNGTGAFQGVLSYPYGGLDLSASDFNNDSLTDLVIVGNAKVNVLISNGSSFSNNFFCGIWDAMVACGDFNKDQRSDILLAGGPLIPARLFLNNSATIPLPHTTLLCNGGMIAINTSQTSFSTQWNTGVSANPYVINGPGTYVLTSSNFSGSCISTDTLIVATSTLTALPVTLSASKTISCMDTSTITLTGMPAGGNYSGLGVTNNMFNVSQAVKGNNMVYYNAVDTNGCSNADSVQIFADYCVWPGDANEDLTVNNLDLLAVGLEYGKMGPARALSSNGWQPYPCYDWADTLTSGLNIKFTDCNGDGAVNLNDTLAINLNYSLSHNLRSVHPPAIQASQADIFLSFNKSLYYPGDTVLASINIGSASNLQNNFYGTAFTINYDNTKIKAGSERVSFSNSWIGIINQSKIKLAKIFNTLGKIDIGITRTVHSDTSGFGPVGVFEFVLRDTINASEMYFTVSNPSKISNYGNYQSMNTGIDSVALQQGVVGIKQNDNKSFIIYPNPSNGAITIQAGSEPILQVEIYNSLAKRVERIMASSGTVTTDLSLYGKGCFLIKIISVNSVELRKVIIE